MLYLNLLPPKLKKEYEYNSKKRYLAALLSWFFVIFLVVIIFLLVIYFILLFQINEQNIQKSFLMGFDEGGKIAELESKITELNEKISFFQDINGELAVSRLVDIIGFVPENVKLNNVFFDATSGNVILSGTAKNRESLIVLKNNLERSEKVDNFIFPFSNLLRDENIGFSLNFILR